MDPTTIEVIGTALFACAVIHTFLVSKFEKLAHKYPEGSIGENFYHFMGEVEAVFGIWAAIFLGAYTALHGFMIHDPNDHNIVTGGTVGFLETLNFTETVNPDPLPIQRVSISFEAIGVASKYVDMDSGEIMGGGGLTVEEAESRASKIAAAEN